MTDQVKKASTEASTIGPIFNVYPDSLGARLDSLVDLFKTHRELREGISCLYILPSIFHSDLDRGFSVIDYDINEEFAGPSDIRALSDMGFFCAFDLVLNHASVRSPQFQDVLKHGDASVYKDFFIDWNSFWKNYAVSDSTAASAETTAEAMLEDAGGILQPAEEAISKMFFRKPGLPVLAVTTATGQKKAFWNTFYHEITQDSEGRQAYKGQMDLNVRSPLVWNFYAETMKKLASYGAGIVRLDAFAYCSKIPGERNFFNEPETWEILERVNKLAEEQGIRVLPEIHSRHSEGIHRKIAEHGYTNYDFFLPGLLIDAIEHKNARVLHSWVKEINTKNLQLVNMLGCHDGIPVLDLDGLLSPARIQDLIAKIVERGGRIKNLHGKTNMYYQVNATYFSALGENESALIFARAVQMFMPGIPQVWYLDLFAGMNDYAAADRAGEAGHKEINRMNYSREEAEAALQKPVVQEQLRLMKFRKECPAFSKDSVCACDLTSDSEMTLSWQRGEYKAELYANFATLDFEIHDC